MQRDNSRLVFWLFQKLQPSRKFSAKPKTRKGGTIGWKHSNPTESIGLSVWAGRRLDRLKTEEVIFSLRSKNKDIFSARENLGNVDLKKVA